MLPQAQGLAKKKHYGFFPTKMLLLLWFIDIWKPFYLWEAFFIQIPFDMSRLSKISKSDRTAVGIFLNLNHYAYSLKLGFTIYTPTPHPTSPLPIALTTYPAPAV